MMSTFRKGDKAHRKHRLLVMAPVTMMTMKTTMIKMNTIATRRTSDIATSSRGMHHWRCYLHGRMTYLVSWSLVVWVGCCRSCDSDLRIFGTVVNVHLDRNIISEEGLSSPLLKTDLLDPYSAFGDFPTTVNKI